MKSKKYLFGGVITGIVFGSVLVFNSFVFPWVLAAAPEESETQTIPVSGIESVSKSEKPTSESDADGLSKEMALEIVKDADDTKLSFYGISDGVPKEMALEIAKNALKEVKDVSNLPFAIKLARDDTPVDPIKWFVTFYDNNDGYAVQINPYSGEVITVEEFSGVKEVFSTDVEEAKKQKEQLYHKTIYSIYDSKE